MKTRLWRVGIVASVAIAGALAVSAVTVRVGDHGTGIRIVPDDEAETVIGGGCVVSTSSNCQNYSTCPFMGQKAGTKAGNYQDNGTKTCGGMTKCGTAPDTKNCGSS